MRPPTNPLSSDTDLDTIPDNVETNSGVYVDANNDTGTNPSLADTDRDGYLSRPELSSSGPPEFPGLMAASV